MGRFFLCLLLWAMALPAQAGDKAASGKTIPKPILQIDSGGHRALIRDIVFTPDGKYLVSASNDKLIRVWDWRAQKTVRVIRGQVGNGPEGKIYAMALSPDGRYLAAGGFLGSGPTQDAIRLYDFNSGKLLALLKGHENVVNALAFSPDSRRLISSSADFTAIIWDVEIAQEARGGSTATAPNKILLHRLKGHTDDIYAVGFVPLPSKPDKHRPRILSHQSSTSSRHSREGGNDGHVGRKVGGMSGAGETAAPKLAHRYNAVTGSYDHDLRLWDASSGLLIKVMKGHKDKVRALAVSRKGLIASGSWDHTIRLWDGRTGVPSLFPLAGVGRGEGIGNNTLAVQGTQVGRLSFSPDGRRLLSGVVGGPDNHCHVFEVKTGKELVTYKGHDNVVIATAISPDGRFAATGGGDQGQIDIWELETGQRKARLVGAGAAVWAAGFAKSRAGHDYIGWGTTWKRADGGAGHSSETGSPIEHSLRLPDTRQGLGVVQSLSPSPLTGEGRGGGEATGTVSQSSTASAAPPTPSPSPQGGRGEDKLTAKEFRRAIATHGSWRLRHRRGGKSGTIRPEGVFDIIKGEKTIATITRGPTDGYRHRAYSFTPDGQTVISGGANGVLSSYDLAGRTLGDYIGHTGDIWAVTVSPDGRLLVSGSHDQTVRLWNVKTGELIVSLFHGCDSSSLTPSPRPSPQKEEDMGGEGEKRPQCEWAMWTPQGYYTASKGGRSLVGWQLNRGADKAADHLSGAQLHKYLYSPEIINRAIILASAKAAIEEQGAKGDILQQVLADGMPPLVHMVEEPAPSQSDEAVTIRARALDHGGGIGKAEWRVNGITLGVEDRAAILLDGEEDIIKRRFTLEPGENIIELVVYNKKNSITSKPVRTKVTYAPKVKGERPSLHVLTIGVDDYWDSALKLNYSVPDALALGEAFKKGGKALYKSVHVTRLIDKQVTAKRLDTTFKALSKVIKPLDVFVFFVAGHGVTLDGQYYYLPQDVRYSNNEELKKRAISQDMWQRWFSLIPARKSVLLYDTCESGTMTNAPGKKIRGVAQIAAINRLIHATGRAVISATTDDAPALEGYRGHGLFTWTLLEGLARGDVNGDGVVELTELTAHVDRRVPILSQAAFKFRQVPRFDLNGTNYALSKPVKMASGASDDKGPAIPTRPSHIVAPPAKIFAAPDDRSDVIKQFKLHTLVARIREQGTFSLIAKDGRRLGYIKSKHLRPFQ